MRSTMFVEDNNQFPVKAQRLSFSFFILFIIIISFLVIGYICSNIVLMKLGYQSIDLEKKKDELMVQKYQLESTVENLSSLTRIEKIAVQELGMCRPERIEFIAMLPNNIVVDMMAQQPSISESENRFIQAGSLFKEFANLKVFQNQ